jgi:hypothetical protein
MLEYLGNKHQMNKKDYKKIKINNNISKESFFPQRISGAIYPLTEYIHRQTKINKTHTL